MASTGQLWPGVDDEPCGVWTWYPPRILQGLQGGNAAVPWDQFGHHSGQSCAKTPHPLGTLPTKETWGAYWQCHSNNDRHHTSSSPLPWLHQAVPSCPRDKRWHTSYVLAWALQWHEHRPLLLGFDVHPPVGFGISALGLQWGTQPQFVPQSPCRQSCQHTR